ncbi:hypothetical protein LIER_08901 [Lithospermum erythrorhizon]|uniref:DUF4218 domain-containing protein n=1 Tax=Lithospermum erythrorhizon TaxID=34254 RepID=A0AAV3PFE0_LITER
MKKIFPPAYFDVMEHLPVHMPYEALNGGPVQYRCMYPFESYLGRLKRMIRQKVHVEGSICRLTWCYDDGLEPVDDGRLSNRQVFHNLMANDVFQEDVQHVPTHVQSRDDLDDPVAIVDTEIKA